MPGFLKAHQLVLVDKILTADSQEEVKCLCEATIDWLKGQKLSREEVFLFVSQTMEELGRISAAKSDIMQWGCVTAAKVYLAIILKEHRPVKK